jgi:uncharacterized protein
MKLNTPLSNAEMDRLENLLSSEIFRSGAMPLDALQGFFCAVVSGPLPVLPSEWLPEVFGEDYAFDSPEQEEELIELLMRFYNSVAAAMSGGETIDLILYEDDAGAPIYDDWCNGYLHGASLGEATWFDHAGKRVEELAEMMQVFMLLNGAIKEDTLANKEKWMSEKEEKKMLAEAEEDLPDAVFAIYHFWSKQREGLDTTVRREGPKVGRNDMCGCGSGKKFKHCCGKEPTLH